MICAWIVTSSAVVGSSAIRQLRLVGDRHRDHRPLTHSAGELVRILVEPALRIRHADEVEEVDTPLARRLAAHILVRPHRLGELVPDLQHRVERGHRILKDHRDLATPNIAQLLLAHLQQIASAEDCLALHDPTRRLRDQPEDGELADALARTRLADDPERLAGVDIVGDVVDGVDDAVVGRELDDEVAERQDGLRHGSASGSDRAHRAARRRRS